MINQTTLTLITRLLIMMISRKIILSLITSRTTISILLMTSPMTMLPRIVVFNHQCGWYILQGYTSWSYGTCFWTFATQSGSYFPEKIWKGTSIWHSSTKALYSTSCIFHSWRIKSTSLHGVIVVYRYLLHALFTVHTKLLYDVLFWTWQVCWFHGGVVWSNWFTKLDGSSMFIVGLYLWWHIHPWCMRCNVCKDWILKTNLVAFNMSTS